VREASPRRAVTGGVVMAVAAAVGSYVAVRSGRGRRLDEQAAGLAGRSLGSAADRGIGFATDLGSVYGVAGVSAALAAAGHRRLAVDVAGSGLVAWTLAQAAKPLLARERPFEVVGGHRLVAIPAGSSWPSGHAAVAAAMATTLAPTATRATRLGLTAATAGVGISRLYVGVHHLTDVIAGWGLGAVSTAAWQLIQRATARAATAGP